MSSLSDTITPSHKRKQQLKFCFLLQVVKLRQKADQFKSRERETHFTSAHLAWLEEEQSDLLERTSKQSSLSSQSEPNEIEEVKSDSEPSSLLPGDAGNRIPVPPSLPNEAEHEEDMEDDGNQSEGESRDSHEVVTSSQNGRLPTPRLTKASEHRRHHLDRTTPHTGGAILTSPQKKRNDKQNQSSQTSKKVPVSKTDRPQPVWAWDEKSPQSAFTSPSIKRKKDEKSPRQDAGSTHVVKEGSGEGRRKHRTVYDSKNYQGELNTAGNKNKTDKEFTQHKNQEHDRSFRQSLRESSDKGHMKSKYVYDSENYKGDHEDPGITSETNSLEDILHPDYKTKKIETPKFTKPPRAFSVPVDDGTVTLESDVGSLEDVVRPDATAFSKTKRTSVLTQERAQRKDRYLTSTTDFSSVIEDSSASDADPVGKTRTIRHYMPPRSFVVPTERKYGKGLNKKQDEDIDELLSESSMSARSFLASETLQRAKTRKDNFWK